MVLLVTAERNKWENSPKCAALLNSLLVVAHVTLQHGRVGLKYVDSAQLRCFHFTEVLQVLVATLSLTEIGNWM